MKSRCAAKARLENAIVDQDKPKGAFLILSALAIGSIKTNALSDALYAKGDWHLLEAEEEFGDVRQADEAVFLKL